MVLRVFTSVCLTLATCTQTSEEIEMAGLLQSTVTSDAKMLAAFDVKQAAPPPTPAFHFLHDNACEGGAPGSSYLGSSQPSTLQQCMSDCSAKADCAYASYCPTNSSQCSGWNANRCSFVGGACPAGTNSYLAGYKTYYCPGCISAPPPAPPSGTGQPPASTGSPNGTKSPDDDDDDGDDDDDDDDDDTGGSSTGTWSPPSGTGQPPSGTGPRGGGKGGGRRTPSGTGPPGGGRGGKRSTPPPPVASTPPPPVASTPPPPVASTPPPPAATTPPAPVAKAECPINMPTDYSSCPAAGRGLSCPYGGGTLYCYNEQWLPVR